MVMKDIIRFKRKGASQLIFRDVTDKQAVEWCSNDLTHKSESFDGFAPAGTYCTAQKPKYAHYFPPNKLTT